MCSVLFSTNNIRISNFFFLAYRGGAIPLDLDPKMRYCGICEITMAKAMVNPIIIIE